MGAPSVEQESPTLRRSKDGETDHVDHCPRKLGAIGPDEMDWQRSRGFPDVHPEDYCHRCHAQNVSWFTPSPLWNAVADQTPGMTRLSIICPPCFMYLAEAVLTLADDWIVIVTSGGTWKVFAREILVELDETRGDGAVYNWATDLYEMHEEETT